MKNVSKDTFLDARISSRLGSCLFNIIFFFFFSCKINAALACSKSRRFQESGKWKQRLISDVEGVEAGGDQGISPQCLEMCFRI